MRRLASIVAVGGNPALRRIEGGFLLFSLGEWASWFAIVVYAFGRGGAGEAGIVGFAIGAPCILVAPAASLLGDRWPRARVLLGSYVTQAGLMLATAAALLAGAAFLAYFLAAAVMAVISLSRPALSSLLPEVARSPDELTAANVATGIAEGAGALSGPLVAGVLLGLGGAELVYITTSLGTALAALALVPVAAAPSRAWAAAPARPPLGLSGAARILAGDLTAGAAAVLADRRLTALFAILAASIGLLGALSVFIVVIAIERLGLDQGSAGYLAAATGFGALVGSILSVVLVGRERLGLPLLGAAIFFGCAVAALALASTALVVVPILVATGMGWSFVYVAATTLTQRLAGDDVMTRVFGVAEAVTTGSEAIGGLAVPVLIVLFGPTGALVAAGLALPLVALVAAPAFLRADRADPRFLRDLRTIRAVPMFTPLAAQVLEQLAAGGQQSHVPAGTVIVREGEVGDRFYVIVEGRVGVDLGGVPARELGPGDSFGEIALLRDLPRTATVRAISETDLLAIDREPFLAALTGQPRSRAVAVDLAARRLAGEHV